MIGILAKRESIVTELCTLWEEQFIIGNDLTDYFKSFGNKQLVADLMERIDQLKKYNAFMKLVGLSNFRTHNRRILEGYRKVIDFGICPICHRKF